VQDRQHRSLLSRKQFYHNYLLPSRVLRSKAIRKHVLLHWSWAHFYIIRNMQCTHAGTLLRDHIIRYQPMQQWCWRDPLVMNPVERGGSNWDPWFSSQWKSINIIITFDNNRFENETDNSHPKLEP
jgi:hypothetical protein